ncbi:ATP-binding cassette domain-containing protein [Kitasatospora sp. NPDC101801]|uniref:ABC transporter ATP-binding protein n=1 Tax=Kitasatospora sp. NPDC101801 TaxID=3364103 RepID=UPI00380BDD9A
MIQITGLTKVYRRGRAPALLDLSFDARPGVVTALLGAEGAGKTTALRLMVELERGQGITLFDGRTYRRLRRPERHVGVLLPGADGDVAASGGHPGLKARAHLRMLAGAVGVPASRADELLEQTRLAGVAGHRLRSFSPGMHRRLALAVALLGSPGTLLLDAPTEGLSPRNVEWFHSFLRSFAVSGGTVLVTTRTPREAALLADRVVTLDQGRLVADQPVVEFRRTRLHPEVSVRGPQMARLADLLTEQGHQVRRDGGVGIAVSGLGRTEIGELAYRHGILLHELADRVVEQPVPYPALPTASGRSGHVLPIPPDAPGAQRGDAQPPQQTAQSGLPGQADQSAHPGHAAEHPGHTTERARQPAEHPERPEEQTATLVPQLAAAGAGAGAEQPPHNTGLTGRQLFRDEAPAPHPTRRPTPWPVAGPDHRSE